MSDVVWLLPGKVNPSIPHLGDASSFILFVSMHGSMNHGGGSRYMCLPARRLADGHMLPPWSKWYIFYILVILQIGLCSHTHTHSSESVSHLLRGNWWPPHTIFKLYLFGTPFSNHSPHPKILDATPQFWFWFHFPFPICLIGTRKKNCSLKS